MKALIIGATGATGRDLVNVLLQDRFYTEVVLFVRRETGMAHPKLTEVLTDFDTPQAVAGFIQGDILFSCLGTTRKAAGSKEKQWHIDYEIPLQFAGIAKRKGISTMVLLSSYGASAASRVFYAQLKGKLEDAISRLLFSNYIIFRPGLLLRKETNRAGERISAVLIQVLNRLGIIKQFKPMPTRTLAEKMAVAPRIFASGKNVVALDKIFGL